MNASTLTETDYVAIAETRVAASIADGWFVRHLMIEEALLDADAYPSERHDAMMNNCVAARERRFRELCQ